MDETKRFSRVIGEIYDATLDPARWPAVLELTASFVGGCASALFMKDAARKTHNIVHTWGYDPVYSRMYLEKYVKLDPFTTGQFFFEVERPVTLADLMPHDDFRETRFYTEWVRPQHWIDALGVTLDKSVTTYAAHSVIRHERDGIADDVARRRMGLLAPHMRRAVLISKVIDLQKIEAAMLADTLDGLVTAMLLVEAGGRIVHANAAGYALLAEARILRSSNGKLVTGDAGANSTLQEIFATAANGDLALGSNGIAVPLTTPNGDRHVAHVLPLTSGARRRANTAYAAVAAVFVRRAELAPPSPPELIARSYRLTPSELRVLLSVVEVGGVQEVALALGISEATVRTHLQRLFQKTGSKRQADLVKLVAGYMSPLT
jgi:DNA-binding CsgD family transcriptional regulator